MAWVSGASRAWEQGHGLGVLLGGALQHGSTDWTFVRMDREWLGEGPQCPAYCQGSKPSPGTAQQGDVG